MTSEILEALVDHFNNSYYTAGLILDGSLAICSRHSFKTIVFHCSHHGLQTATGYSAHGRISPGTFVELSYNHPEFITKLESMVHQALD